MTATMRLSCEAIARAFRGEPARKVGDELYYHHGANGHVDRDPSVKINTVKDVWIDGPCGKDGNAWELAAFFIDCDPNDKKTIAAALRERGLLGSSDSDANGSRNGHKTARGIKGATSHSEPAAKVAEFYYTPDLRKVRLEWRSQNGEKKPQKTFVWEHREGDNWIKGQGGLEVPLYCNKSFRERDQVKMAIGLEGEGKADLAAEMGLAAFSFKDLTAAQCRSLAGVEIILWPDKDEPGSKLADKAAKIIVAIPASPMHPYSCPASGASGER